MKTLRSCLKAGQFFILSLTAVMCGGKVFAQTGGYTIPVVTVQATQPIATATNSGVLTVFRAGSTDATLNVWYDLGGTASNGVDYASIPPHLVAIAAGTISNTIVVTPLNRIICPRISGKRINIAIISQIEVTSLSITRQTIDTKSISEENDIV